MNNLKVGKEDESSGSTSSIELESSFIARIEYCASRAGSVSALARKAKISQSGIRRYFSGGEPTRPHLVALAQASGVSLLWLATGEVDPDQGAEASPQPSPGATDMNLEALEEVAVKVLAVLEKSRPDLSAKARGRIVRLVYEFYIRQDKPMDEVSLSNVIELAAFR